MSKTARKWWAAIGIGGAMGCVVALIQGNGTIGTVNVCILGILGTLFLFGAAIGLKWYKAPFPIGTAVRTFLLFMFCAGLMGATCWHVWPESPQEVGTVITQKIEEQHAVINQGGRYRIEVKPCRTDRLSDCSDEQLYQWGMALYDQIWEVELKFNKTNEAARNTNDIHKKVEIYHAGEVQLAQDFWKCCAADASRYFTEVQSRIGSGHSHEYDETVSWLQGFARPPLFGEKDVTYLDGMMCVLTALQITILHGKLAIKIAAEKQF